VIYVRYVSLLRHAKPFDAYCPLYEAKQIIIKIVIIITEAVLIMLLRHNHCRR